MKIVTLNCFKDFNCIASYCEHNCCLKWDVCIDAKTLEKYKNYKGEFSSCLKDGIDISAKRFKMKTENGVKRCWFLNKDNLCDIYIKLGKKSLCQVCKDHPRYKNYLFDRVEWGIGISCPEGAKRVVNESDISEVISENKRIKKHLNPFEKEITDYRESIVKTLKNEAPLKEKIKKICRFADEEKLFKKDFKDLFLSLEILNTDWKEKLRCLSSIKIGETDVKKEYQKPIINLLIYFIYRHLGRAIDNLDLKSRTVFCVLSVTVIAKILSVLKPDIKTIEDVAREYSEEIEYSIENEEKILDVIDGLLIK